MTLLLPVFAVFGLTACATNPVTGDSDFMLVSDRDAIEIGRQQYGPSLQSQGGEFVIDESLGEYVSEVGQRLAEVSDNPLPYEFTVLNNSVPNAWALPGGKIAINRGLLTELDNEAELAAVLGHEVVHAAARHGQQMISRGTLLQGAVAIGAIASAGNQYSDYIVGASQVGAQLINQRYGREAELEADEFGIRYMVRAGYDPSAAISLQETFVELSEGSNPGWLEGLFASHPPSEERVENNRQLVQELQPEVAGRDLEVGEDRYRRAIAFLTDNAEAYRHFDEAQQAIGNNDLDAAMDSLDSAIAMLPAEARFHGLRADILLYRDDFAAAIDGFDEAIARDDGYFDYYLGRGIAYSRRGNDSQARRDLERSVELLPTAVAMNELGQLALNNNQRDQAKQYFRTAADAGGEIGSQATQSFVRLDIQDNPAGYVQARAFANDNGRIFVRVSNQTPYPLRNVTVEITAAIGDQLARRTNRISVMEAGQSGDIDTGLAFPEGVEWNPEQMRAAVLSASLQ